VTCRGRACRLKSVKGTKASSRGDSYEQVGSEPDGDNDSDSDGSVPQPEGHVDSGFLISGGASAKESTWRTSSDNADAGTPQTRMTKLADLPADNGIRSAGRRYPPPHWFSSLAYTILQGMSASSLKEYTAQSRWYPSAMMTLLWSPTRASRSGERAFRDRILA
jgi:hypothetical protein